MKQTAKKSTGGIAPRAKRLQTVQPPPTTPVASTNSPTADSDTVSAHILSAPTISHCDTLFIGRAAVSVEMAVSCIVVNFAVALFVQTAACKTRIVCSRLAFLPWIQLFSFALLARQAINHFRYIPIRSVVSSRVLVFVFTVTAAGVLSRWRSTSRAYSERRREITPRTDRTYYFQVEREYGAARRYSFSPPQSPRPWQRFGRRLFPPAFELPASRR